MASPNAKGFVETTVYVVKRSIHGEGVCELWRTLDEGFAARCVRQALCRPRTRHAWYEAWTCTLPLGAHST